MTYVLAITIITVGGLQIGVAVPYSSATSCIKAGMEQASAVNGDEVKETWWQCEERGKKTSKR